jgi:hypothetical protein
MIVRKIRCETRAVLIHDLISYLKITPGSCSEKEPNTPRTGGGYDPVLGATAGHQVNLRVGGADVPITFPARFVVITGGAYFFTPSILALKAMTAAPAATPVT